MTSPYRKTAEVAADEANVRGHVMLAPRGWSPTLIRVAPTVVLAALLVNTHGFGLWPEAVRTADGIFAAMWWSLTLGPPLGAFCEVALSGGTYRTVAATATGDSLYYRHWGFRRTIAHAAFAAARKIGEEVVLARRDGERSIVFRPRRKGALPAWMTRLTEATDGSWSFAYGSDAPVFLGAGKTLLWFFAVFFLFLIARGFDFGCFRIFVFFPVLVMEAVGFALLIMEVRKPRRTAALTRMRGVWLLHVRAPGRSRFIPVRNEHGLGTTSLQVPFGDETIAWAPPGGALPDWQQAQLIAALDDGTQGSARSGQPAARAIKSKSEEP